MSCPEQSEISLAERRGSLRTDRGGVQGCDHRRGNHAARQLTHTHIHRLLETVTQLSRLHNLTLKTCSVWNITLKARLILC